MRKVMLTLLLSFVSVILFSCVDETLVPDEKSIETNDQAEPSEVVLEFWHTYSDQETEVFENEVLPRFESLFPTIKINAVRKDYTEQLKNDIHAAVAENRQPDVMRMDIIWVAEFAKKGSLEMLSVLPGFDTLKDNFIGSLLDTAKFEGAYYGLPVNANTKTAIFNRDLLAKSGLSAPPTSLDELASAVRSLRKTDNDVYGIGICCSSGWGALPYFWSLGGDLTDESYTHASGYLDSSQSLQALNTIKKWYDEGIISPAIVGGEPGNWDGILKGKLFMIDEAHWFYTVNEVDPNNKPLLENTMVGLFPAGTNEGTSIIGGENLVMFRNTAHREEAWQFMNWLVSEEPQRLMAETGLIPTIKQIEAQTLPAMFSPYLQQLDHAKPRPPIAAWTEVDDVFAVMIEKILTEEESVELAVQKAVEQIDLILAND